MGKYDLPLTGSEAGFLCNLVAAGLKSIETVDSVKDTYNKIYKKIELFAKYAKTSDQAKEHFYNMKQIDSLSKPHEIKLKPNFRGNKDVESSIP